MAQSGRSMEARTGRSKQRYAADGSRLVCGVVAVSDDKKKVLVVESTARKNHWVLPKGGYETDEARPEDAALREAWEEAGIVGRITKNLGEIPDPRQNATTSQSTSSPQKTLYMFFEVKVDREETPWPEMNKRARRWFTFNEAIDCFKKMGRPELIEAVTRSSVLR